MPKLHNLRVALLVVEMQQKIGSRVLDLNLSQFQDELAQIRKYAEDNKIPIGANGFMGDETVGFFSAWAFVHKLTIF